MSAPAATLEAMCAEALREHLADGSEQTLHSAYELARRAMAKGLGVVDMTAMLHRALGELWRESRTLESADRLLPRFESFALECFSPFEMAHRGARETNAVLRSIQERREEDLKRVAHEIHDSAGQLLVTVYLALEGAARALGPDAASRLDPVRARLDEVELDLRRLSHELRPTVLDDLGLMPALQQLGLSNTRRTGITIRVRGEIDERLPAAVETAIYRIVQEALTNVARHSGAANTEIELQRLDAGVHCRVEDDGRGFDLSVRGSSAGIGLSGMRERLVPLGGKLQIASSPGHGTTLEVTIPLESPDDATHPAG